ncbi:MAG TPA: hypothetical protein VIX91_19065, partial [Candidatus Acidoferrum sp.]
SVLGTSSVGAVPISVPDPFLVVGIPAPDYPAVDIFTLFFHSHVCSGDVPVVRAVFPEQMADYDSFKAYFYSRRQWIFS